MGEETMIPIYYIINGKLNKGVIMKDFYSFLSTLRPHLSLGITLDWFFGLCRTDMISHIEAYAKLKSDTDKQSDGSQAAEREDWQDQQQMIRPLSEDQIRSLVIFCDRVSYPEPHNIKITNMAIEDKSGDIIIEYIAYGNVTTGKILRTVIKY